MPFNKSITILILSTLLCNYTLQAQNQYPVPAGNVNQLFYLQRTENLNTVVYELNKEDRNLNIQYPIHVFWIMYSKNEKHESLSDFEKEFAYGIKITSHTETQCWFTLAAYPKITLKLDVGEDKKYHVYVTPFKQPMILSSVFIKTKKDFLKIEPDIEYIEFSGINITCGKIVTEKIIP